MTVLLAELDPDSIDLVEVELEDRVPVRDVMGRRVMWLAPGGYIDMAVMTTRAMETPRVRFGDEDGEYVSELRVLRSVIQMLAVWRKMVDEGSIPNEPVTRIHVAKWRRRGDSPAALAVVFVGPEPA